MRLNEGPGLVKAPGLYFCRYQGCLCAACQFSLPAPTSVSGQSILGQRRRPASTYGAVSSHAPEGARANHTGIIGPKRMWEPACRRCAARAALGLTGAAFLSPYKWQPSRDPTAAPTNPIIRSMLRQQTSKDRIRAARCLPWFLRCCADRAPPAFTGAAFLSPYKWQPSRDPRQPNKPHNHVYACGSTAPRAALAGRFISQS